MARKKINKMRRVMHEFKAGKLRSGSKFGAKVTSRKQAIAIGLSESERAGEYRPPRRKKARRKKSR